MEVPTQSVEVMPPGLQPTDDQLQQLPVGSYRIPFTLQVPADAFPSDVVKPTFPGKAGSWLEKRSVRGGRVEHTLEASLVAPANGMWDTLHRLVKNQSAKEVVTVLPTHQPGVEAVLGGPQCAEANLAMDKKR